MSRIRGKMFMLALLLKEMYKKLRTNEFSLTIQENDNQ